MKPNIERVFFSVFAGLFCVLAVSAQDDQSMAAIAGDRYVISARAGGINQVEGSVTVLRKDGTSGRLLKGDTLEIGDRVSTDRSGKVEILLNPGSYVRLGGNSSFEFETTSLNDLRLRLHKGMAALEVFAANDFTVSVNTPTSDFLIVESGVYRLDVGSTDARLSVTKGRAHVGGSSGPQVRSGRQATVSPNGTDVARFDTKRRDDLDEWSRSRSRDLAKVVASLDRNEMRNSLLNSFYGRQWDMFNSFGLWVYDPFGRGYCFLPFGWGWRSPYGWGFGSYIGWYNLPPIVYYPRRMIPQTPGTPTSTGNTPTTGTTTTTSSPRDTSKRGATIIAETPPFESIQRSGRVPRDRGMGLPPFPGSRGRDEAPPVFAPPPPVISAPSTGGSDARNPKRP
jgi:hypothetical protein